MTLPEAMHEIRELQAQLREARAQVARAYRHLDLYRAHHYQAEQRLARLKLGQSDNNKRLKGDHEGHENGAQAPIASSNDAEWPLDLKNEPRAS